MIFAWPQFLALAVVPVALLVWDLIRRRRAILDTRPKILRADAGRKTLKIAAPDAHARSVGRPRYWLAAGLALASVALARPQWGQLDEEVFDQSREIVIAVDLSRSMLTQDVKPSRLERSKLLIQSMLERLQGERVGLLLFAGTAFLQSPLSADYEILNEFLPNLSPKTLPEGGSDYGAMMDAAVQAFAGSSAADRFLVVLSDGEATDDDWRAHLDPLKEKGVRVIGLGVGTAMGAVIPDGAGGLIKDQTGAVVMSKLENKTLQELASATGGIYKDASTWLDINSLLQSTVETGRKGAFVEKSRVRRSERFQWFLAPAFLLLLMSFAREFPVRPQPRELTLTGMAKATSLLLLLVAMAQGLQTNAFALEAIKPPAPAAGPSASAGPMADRTAGKSAEAGLPAVGSAEAGSTLDENPGLGPLTETVQRLSRTANRTAGDWSEMAQDTVAFGEHIYNQKQPVPEGPVNDGLAAVDAGEALDGKAADWVKLRKSLNDLLNKPPEEPPPEDQKDQDNPQQQKGGDKKQGDKGDGGDTQKGGDDMNPDQDNADAQDVNPGGDQQDPADMDAQSEEDAFGDMNQQAGEIAPTNPQNQKVGQSREAKPIEVDPTLTLPLQKLEQLKNQDSPARLFQLMEGPPKPGEENKKDW